MKPLPMSPHNRYLSTRSIHPPKGGAHPLSFNGQEFKNFRQGESATRPASLPGDADRLSAGFGLSVDRGFQTCCRVNGGPPIRPVHRPTGYVRGPRTRYSTALPVLPTATMTSAIRRQ